MAIRNASFLSMIAPRKRGSRASDEHRPGAPAFAGESTEIRRKGRDERGYTLVELLVVLAILGMLVAIAAPQVIKYLSKAKVDTATIQIKQLGGILDMYNTEVGHYPTATLV